MRYILFAIAFTLFLSAPDSLDKGISAWACLIGSAAVMIWVIRKEKENEY